jgi:hypothetical protein
VKQSILPNSVKKSQRKSLPNLPSEETVPLDVAASAKVKVGGAEGTGSLTELCGSEMNAEFAQGPSQSEVTPNEQEPGEHVAA